MELLSGTSPSLCSRTREETEPTTSAREARIEDVDSESVQPHVEDQMVPRTPPPLVTGLRGRYPGPRREQRSQGRSRTRENLWCDFSESDDLVLQECLCDFGEILFGDFESSEVFEYVSLNALRTEVKQRKEVVYHRLDRQNQERFREAMRAEWRTNILRPEAARLIPLSESLDIRKNVEKSARVVPTRWVLTEKDMGLKSDTMAKARLVLQGFKDPDLGDLDVAAPTLARDTLPILLQVIASLQWNLTLLDIKGAFMSSRRLERSQGPLYASIPKLWPFPEEANVRQLVEIKCAWYGRNDGPREFYETLCQELVKLGCHRSVLDPCLFQWFHNAALQGIVGATVDDLCCGGSELFQKQVIESLRQRFTFGKLETGSGRFLGRDLRQQADGSIWIDQVDYIDKIVTVDIPKDRRMDKSSPLSDDERSLLRAKAGELNWIQTVSRPDLAGSVSLLQMSFGQPTVTSLLEANRLIRDAKQNKVVLKIQAIPIDQLRFMCTADAAWGNCLDLASHMGFMVMATHYMANHGCRVPFSPLIWRAHKQRRKAASTLSAETMASGVGLGALDWVRTLFEECVCVSGLQD